MTHSQMLRYRSASPPLMRGSQFNNNNPAIPQNLRGSGMMIVNSSGMQSANNYQINRLRSQPH